MEGRGMNASFASKVKTRRRNEGRKEGRECERVRVLMMSTKHASSKRAS